MTESDLLKTLIDINRYLIPKQLAVCVGATEDLKSFFGSNSSFICASDLQLSYSPVQDRPIVRDKEASTCKESQARSANQ
jgi:hypothetical protein